MLKPHYLLKTSSVTRIKENEIIKQLTTNKIYSNKQINIQFPFLKIPLIIVNALISQTFPLFCFPITCYDRLLILFLKEILYFYLLEWSPCNTRLKYLHKRYVGKPVTWCNLKLNKFYLIPFRFIFQFHFKSKKA